MPGHQGRNISVWDKLAALDELHAGQSKKSVARNVTKKTGCSCQPKQITDWEKKEGQLRNTPNPRTATQARSQKVRDGDSGKYPEMEKELYNQFAEARAKKWPVDNRWLIYHGRMILNRLDPDHRFTFSSGWVKGFTNRKKLAPRKGSLASKKTDEERKADIIHFLKFTRDQCAARRYELSEIANVDQSGVFVLNNRGRTYEIVGTRNVEMTAPGLMNFKCTMVLMVSADGGTRAKPLVIFKPDGDMTREDCDREAAEIDGCLVQYQDNAWATAEIMAWWARHIYAGATAYPNENRPRLLVLDTFKGHLGRRSPFYHELRALNAVRAVIPGGSTGDLQPLDLDFNKAMKQGLKRKDEAWMSTGTNESDYYKGLHRAKDRRVLFGNWVGEVFVEVGRQKSESMKSVFRRVGISLPSNGSEDDVFRITRYPDVRMPPPIINLDEDDVGESNVDPDAMQKEGKNLQESDLIEGVLWFGEDELDGAVVKEEELEVEKDVANGPVVLQGDRGKGRPKEGGVIDGSQIEVISLLSDDDDDVDGLPGGPNSGPCS